MKTRLIFYDIESDPLRTRLAKKLEALGFARIQYSVFCGGHNDTQWKFSFQEIKSILIDNLNPKDKVGILIINPGSLREMSYFGDTPDFDEILGKKLVIWI